MYWVTCCVQDERSLEDKILHHNPMREDASDEEQAKSDDEHESGRCGLMLCPPASDRWAVPCHTPQSAKLQQSWRRLIFIFVGVLVWVRGVVACTGWGSEGGGGVGAQLSAAPSFVLLDMVALPALLVPTQ